MLLLLPLLPLHLLLSEQDPQQLQAFALCHIAHVLAQLQQKTPVRDDLLRPLEARVELALPSNARPSIVKAPVVEGRVSVCLSALSLELDHIVFVVDGVGVDVGARPRWAVDSPAFGFEGTFLAGGAVVFH